MTNHDKLYSWEEGGRTDPCSSSHVRHVNCDAQGVRGGTEGMERATLISPTWQHVSRDEKSLPKPPLHSPKKTHGKHTLSSKTKVGV